MRRRKFIRLLGDAEAGRLYLPHSALDLPIVSMRSSNDEGTRRTI